MMMQILKEMEEIRRTFWCCTDCVIEDKHNESNDETYQAAADVFAFRGAIVGGHRLFIGSYCFSTSSFLRVFGTSSDELHI